MQRGRWSGKEIAWVVAALVAYLAISFLAYWPVGPLDNTQIVSCACTDRIQEVWFLAWTFHALSHAMNPFSSAAMNYPYGVNLVDNTSMPLIGLLASPVTAIFGPIAAFGLFTRLAFFASATSMMLVLRRYTKWLPAAFLGGLLYGFSPYVVDQGLGHLFVAFVPIPPLVVLVVDELLRRQRGDARRYGVILGLLFAAQFFISIEVLVTTVMCCVAGILFVVVIWHSAVRQRATYALRGAKWALGTFVVIVAYPVYWYFLGTWHVTKQQHTPAQLASYHADLFGTIIPTISQLLSPHGLAVIGTSYVGRDISENDSYLGIPLVLLVLVLFVWNRRDRFVLSIAFVGFFAYILSLGSPLVVGNHTTSIVLPFAIVKKIPMINDLIASRFALYVDLASAIVLAIGLDRWKESFRSADKVGQNGPRRRLDWISALRHRVSTAGLVALVGVGALVPLVPRLPLKSQPADAPSYFTSAAVQAIPNGSAVVTYPFDMSATNYAMLWQAVSGFSFKIVGGEAAKPPLSAAQAGSTLALTPWELMQLFEAGYLGDYSIAPKLDPRAELLVYEFLTRWHIGTIVLLPVGVNPGMVVHYLTVVLGRPPVKVGGVEVWYHADGPTAQWVFSKTHSP
jgi:hypothetical protein